MGSQVSKEEVVTFLSHILKPTAEAGVWEARKKSAQKRIVKTMN